ncbi:hypothetical protein FisN_40Lh018 [Fistulifera solaris]|uniref:Uncharacterized protein n=1 Tax=Fistulifera solaris TaxID=1519565 RepID=A0A1Z5J9Q8_FISSO|nr:hypothetical protein FisN_40Lh018 [Fistulifera solaris]|eukprot:GAX10548.1 hypothetical protein FisN_40Lh018 [Fistulifera solaris]
MLSPSPDFAPSHDVRSSVSGLAPIGNMFSPIPCSVAQSKELQTPRQSPFSRTDQRYTLQGKTFDNFPELSCESKLDRVIVETVDDDSDGSVDCCVANLAEPVSEDKISEDSQHDATVNSPRVHPNLGNDQRNPLAPTTTDENHDIREKPSAEINFVAFNSYAARSTMGIPVNLTDKEEGLAGEVEEESLYVKGGIDVSTECQEEVSTSVDHKKINDSFEREGLHGDITKNDDVECQNVRLNHLDGVQLNDSFASTGSNREEEIQQAQYVLGATSMAFMDRLRGASLRRKLNLARNRDSLVNKEKAQREAIAASEAAKTSLESRREISTNHEATKEPTDSNQFKARPLSKAILKSGGISGVRFVEKRPVTTPCSPLLGPRRENRQSLEPKSSENSDGNHEADFCVFKARPWPRRKIEHAGTYGVPKVEKRPTTIPESPLLGHRRRKAESKLFSKSVNKILQLDLRTPSLPPKLVNRPFSTANKENAESSTRGIPDTHIEAYVPHSTLRASQRAEYDTQRCEREQRRRARTRQESLAQVKALREEMNVLLSKL